MIFLQFLCCRFVKMVRNYKRNTDRAERYSVKSIERALRAIEIETSICAAARDFGIACETLRDHWRRNRAVVEPRSQPTDATTQTEPIVTTIQTDETSSATASNEPSTVVTETASTEPSTVAIQSTTTTTIFSIFKLFIHLILLFFHFS